MQPARCYRMSPTADANATRRSYFHRNVLTANFFSVQLKLRQTLIEMNVLHLEFHMEMLSKHCTPWRWGRKKRKQLWSPRNNRIMFHRHHLIIINVERERSMRKQVQFSDDPMKDCCQQSLIMLRLHFLSFFYVETFHFGLFWVIKMNNWWERIKMNEI